MSLSNFTGCSASNALCATTDHVEGLMLTKPGKFNGKKLEINSKGSAMYIHANTQNQG